MVAIFFVNFVVVFAFVATVTLHLLNGFSCQYPSLTVGLPEGEDWVPPSAESCGMLGPHLVNKCLIFLPLNPVVGLQFQECTAGGEVAPRAWPYLGRLRNLGQR